MNLKQAAARLGVHYQTAYRWVRSGDLMAVRVGARYEVSDAAIHQFLATRESVLRQAVPQPRSYVRATEDPDEVLEDLEAMAGDPLISIPALLAYAARRGREALGDLCLVAITRPDGSIERAALDHPHAVRAAFVASALSVTGPTPPRMGAVLLAPVLDKGLVVRVPHVPQDRLRAGLRPELRQYLGDHPVVGLVAAPIRVADDVRGMVVFSRDTPADPYTEADEVFAERFAERIGALVVASREIEAAWRHRERLVGRFNVWLAQQPTGATFEPADVAGLLADEDADTAVVVYDPKGLIIGASEAVEQITRYEAGALIGHTFDDIVDPSDAKTERESFARLASGELDYHDFHVNRRRSDGTTLDFAMHRVVVRHLDTSLACVISVGRPVRVSSRIKDLIGAD